MNINQKLKNDGSITIDDLVKANVEKAAKKNAQDSYGNFGYKIYKDQTYLGFTEKNYFNISDEDDPFATYKIVTTYENYNAMDSSGAIFELEPNYKYTYELLVPENGSYIINDNLDSWDKKPSSSDIKIYKDDEELKNYKTTITITNSNDDEVSNITTNKKET